MIAPRQLLKRVIASSKKSVLWSIKVLSKTRESFDAINYFSGKSVVIVGPGSDIDEDLLKKVRLADICVLINKGYRLNSFPALRDASKKIVLFHCLDQREDVGGGKIDSIALKMDGFSEIFYPLNDESIEYQVDDFHRHNFSLIKLYRVEKKFFSDIRHEIGGFWPNTGAAAIYITSAAQNSSVYIHGITFYRTPYVDQYATHLKSIIETIKFIETYRVHNPDLELLYLKRLLRSRNIQLSRQLQEILDQPYFPYFYQVS